MLRVLLLILLALPFLSYSRMQGPFPRREAPLPDDSLPAKGTNPPENLLLPEGDDSVTIYFADQGNQTQFSAGLRPLRQIAGAPEAFYTYYWEFGDGTFSFNEMPVHTYAAEGEYEVRLYATNNYDDGKAPPSRAKKYRKKNPVSQSPAPTTPSAPSAQESADRRTSASRYFKDDHALMLKTNRMPRPEEEMVLIAGYRHPAVQGPPLSGTLVLFFNETQFRKENFELTEVRTWHDEQEVPWSSLLAKTGMTAYVPHGEPTFSPGEPAFSPGEPALSQDERPMLASVATGHGPMAGAQPVIVVSDPPSPALNAMLAEKSARYESRRLWRFNGLEAREERFFFITLKTTPEMIRDTNAIVTMDMTLIPDDPTREPVSETIEMQIVVSHDPNKASVNNRRMNYRFIGKEKELKYKVRFQNTGKGPAALVDIGVSLSEMVDLSTIRLVDQYPQCVPCGAAYAGQSCLDTVVTADSVHFIFRNIYLPGKRQQGVDDADSTKGFVEFYARLKEKPPKLPFYTQAAIVFDRNEPIRTNRAYNRFLPGISPAVIAGYGWSMGSGGQPAGSFVLGGSVAPYSPYKIYFQAEAYLGVHRRQTYGSAEDYQWDDRTGPERVPRITLNDSVFFMASKRVSGENELITLDVVPLHVRKNWSDRLATGLGAWVAGSIHRRSSRTETMDLRYFSDKGAQGTPGWASREYSVSSASNSKAFASTRVAAFADLSFGRVRVGPSLGLRYLHFFSPGEGRLMIYTTWRL